MNITTVTAANPGPFTLTGTKSYVLDESIVIDPGPTDTDHVDALIAAAPRLMAILVTHRHADHAPAASVLRQRTGAKIFAPPGALPADSIDHLLDGDERLHIGGRTLRVIATPGHTAEHVCFLTDDGELFTGDTVLGEGTTVIFPPDGDMALYLASLRRLVSLQPRIIFPGHGPSRPDAVELLEHYIQHRLSREEQIVSAVSSGATTIRELRSVIYATLDQRLHQAAELQLEAHLVHLVAQRRITSRTGRYFAA